MKGEDNLCFKDLYSDLVLQDKFEKIFKEYIDKNEDGKVNHELKKFKDYLIDNIHIKRLEFARALHAEENAILQVATYGGMGIKGGTIYTTTFPCELCAKKIYQSGIKRIVYTEPYPDSISENIFLKDGTRYIVTEQFEGVKSICFYKLFKPPVDRKELQLIEYIDK